MIQETAKPAGARIVVGKRISWFRLAVWVLAAIALFSVFCFFVVPPLLRSKLNNELSRLLHRPVSIEKIHFNPYTMTASVHGLAVKEPQGSAAAFSFAELFVNLQFESLYRLAPVLKELRLVKPYVHLVRNENGSYNFQDLIDEMMSGPSGPTPKFALYNIKIIDGEIDFEDRPENVKHKISSLKIGVPFISSIPAYVDIKVQPEFSALINGSPVAITGSTKPFKDSLDSEFHFNIDNLNIPKYLEYAPVKLNFTLPSGRIDGKLIASFRSAKNQPAALAIKGDLAVEELAVQQSGNTPLLKLPSLALALDALELISRKATIKTLKLQGVDLYVRRSRDGKLNLDDLFTLPAQKTADNKTTAPPFIFNCDEVSVESSTLHWIDEVPQRGFQTRLDNFNLNIKSLTNEDGKKATVDLSFETERKERFKQSGSFQLGPLAVDGKVEIAGLRPADLRPYYDKEVAVEIKDGLLDIEGSYSLEQKNDTNRVKFSDVNASLRNLRLFQPGRNEPLWILPAVSFKGAAADLDAKTILIDKIEARDGSGFAERESDGRLSYYRLLRPSASPQAPAEPVKQAGPDWRVDAKQIVFDRFRLQFDDHVPATPTTIRLSDGSLRIDNYSTAKNQRSKAVLQTRINNKGQARVAGVVGHDPLIGIFAVTATDIEVLPFQPYFESDVLFLLTGGQVNTEGKLAIDGTGAGPTKVNYEGSVAMNDFGAVDKSGSQDLFKWKTLGFNGVQFALEPMQIRIGEINLSDFYTRLVLGSDGKLNLTKLAVQKDAAPEVKEAATTKPTSAAQAPPADEKPISIGKIALQGGQIDFSDFFVKPNYNANLTAVQGTISELKPDLAGDIAVTAKLQSSAPVDINGKINPLAKNLFLDIVADAREIELQPFSPYSGKYVGYDIEKGQLSFKVKYKVEDRKLQAENRITLNQLTFGNKVESPEATKLPVLLAVALLKDRNGVIDVDLPISGSLDDPQFSVGGIIWQIIGNILLKAVTSPFALLGAAFGGGGEELSYIEFDYGLAVIPQSGETKIKNLVAAMNDRPGLKLEVGGRVDPVNDLEGLKKALIDRKVKAQKLKDLVRQGNAPGSVDQVQIGKDEYEKYLKAAYGEESFEKPRNMIGLARDLPAPEMEALMLKNTKVTDEDLRDLGNRRAQAVRDRLLTAGISADRLFTVAPKPLTDAEKEKSKLRASRVDFSLR